jgi:broad specificity phosphatase PhoE
MDMPFTLYASPIPRAMETAKVVSRRLGRCVTHLNALQEAVAGNLAGLTDDKMQQRYPNFMERWNSNAGTAIMPGGESIDAVRIRVWEAIVSLYVNHRDDVAVAITHNQTIRTIIATVLNMSLRHFRRLSCALGSITRLDLSEEGPLLISLNATWHLTKILPQNHTSDG